MKLLEMDLMFARRRRSVDKVPISIPIHRRITENVFENLITSCTAVNVFDDVHLNQFQNFLLLAKLVIGNFRPVPNVFNYLSPTKKLQNKFGIDSIAEDVIFNAPHFVEP